MNRPRVPAPRGVIPGPHEFEPDPDVPRDYIGRTFCLRCHLPGKAGDDRHRAAAVEALQAAREIEDRRLGERP